jgi:glucokinase
MILAGDVGGTKTILALISMERGVEDPVREERFPSGKYESLEAIVAEFLKDSDVTLDAASFGVCGPVVGGEAHITNLPWVIRADTIEKAFGIPKVNILNDLQAIATAIPHQRADEIHTLNDGQRDPTGTIGVIAPGTGLGEAFMVWTGSRYLACATEGGHASFGPVTHEQVKLLSYLEPRFGHVSYERVCSGSAIPNLYDYLRSQRLYEEPDWLREELAAAKDRTPIIMNAAQELKAEICIATLDLFVRILGGVVGNMALRVFATGGLYLGGGIPPRILSRLEKPDFLEAIRAKGRFRGWISRIPVHVILDPKVALHGAAWDGLESIGR